MTVKLPHCIVALGRFLEDVRTIAHNAAHRYNNDVDVSVRVGRVGDAGLNQAPAVVFVGNKPVGVLAVYSPEVKP